MKRLTLIKLLFIFIICFNHALKLNSDEILPYPNGDHEDTSRTHRYVRDCQRVIHGNRTHESMKPKYLADSHETFYFRIKDKKDKIYGHRTIIKNPLKMVSVVEPKFPGSCSQNILSTVTLTSKREKCVVAVNAGFFNPHEDEKDYGRCIGNIISDRRIVQTSHGIQNACFGIKNDGKILVGYFSEDEVLDKINPFVQLICGVGWVLRNGTVYLNESIHAECKDTETTGPLKRFFDVKAGRSLIGYDKNGHVHLVQFDGKTWESGVNLEGAAKYMKSLGIINAINFDGGGSSTFTVNSNLVNYPANQCSKGSDELCERNVSTIICVRHHHQNEDNSFDSLTLCCNRNYLIVIGMSVLIGFSILLNVYICGYFMAYRSRFLILSGAKQQKEALKSLLDQNGHYSTGDDDSDDDEI